MKDDSSFRFFDFRHKIRKAALELPIHGLPCELRLVGFAGGNDKDDARIVFLDTCIMNREWGSNELQSFLTYDRKSRCIRLPR